MNPKEKADELIEEFKLYAYANTRQEDSSFGRQLTHNAKQCAIIAVDEIIDALNAFGYVGAMYDDYETGDKVFTTDKDPSDFWQQVKNELTK